MKSVMTFEKACAQYVHRFTLEHVPAWSQMPMSNGRYCAPQYRSDREWFENTLFPPDPRCYRTDCYSRNQTWPLGKSLAKPFRKDQ